MRDAPAGHDVGAIVRAARVAAGWRQGELGRRCGYSASQISRWETGRSPLRDVAVLRSLAAALGLHPAVLGVTPDTVGHTFGAAARRPPTVGAALSSTSQEEDDVRRRQFLLAAGLAATAPAVSASTGADPAQELGRALVDLLVGPVAAVAPVPLATLDAALDAARAQFVACRYLPLATTLPALIIAAEATATQQPGPRAHATLARSYALASRVLGKLEASSLHCIAADRGVRAAQAAGNPLLLAEAHRLAGGAMRRLGHHQHAEGLTMAAVDVLEGDVLDMRRLAAAGDRGEAWSMWALLHCSAGYASALRGDRDRARDLLDLAEHATTRLAADDKRAVTANVVSHRVSASLALGDAGDALAHAQRLPLAAVPTVERRARLLVDVAQAWAQWGKPERALTALLTAERTAPGEVHTRSAVRRLVSDLGRSPGAGRLPSLPALAARVHATL